MKIISKNKTIDGNEFLAYAESYETAAKILLKELVSDINPFEISSDDPKNESLWMRYHEYGLFSILYNIRHYLELKLKGLFLTNGGEFEKIKTHSLQSLLDKLGNLIGPQSIPEEVKEYIRKLHEYDSSSEELRYPYDNEGNRFWLGSPEEDISNLVAQRKVLVKRLQEDFSKVSSQLTNLEYNLDVKREYELESSQN